METGIAVTVAVIVAELDRVGVDPEPLLETFGWRRETLAQPLERLPRDAILDFIVQARQLAGDPMLPVRAVVEAPPGAFHLADYITLFAPTIEAGFGRILRHFELVDTAVRFELDVDADPIVATLSAHDGAPAHPIEAVCLLCSLTSRLALLSPDTGGALWLELQRHPDVPLDALSALARCPVRLGRHDRIAVARATWQARSGFAEPTIAELLARLSLSEGTASTRAPADTMPALRRRVESTLVRLLRVGQATVTRVARRLELSPRTLQRRLTALGLSFTDLLDDTRRRLATRYLSDDSLSITEVALRLGYAETSAFSRAFGRWYGRSPSDWRKTPETDVDHDDDDDDAPQPDVPVPLSSSPSSSVLEAAGSE